MPALITAIYWLRVGNLLIVKFCYRGGQKPPFRSIVFSTRRESLHHWSETMNTILLRRKNEICLWIFDGEIVSSNYGTVGKAAMKSAGVVSVEVAHSQIQSHLDHGWKVV